MNIDIVIIGKNCQQTLDACIQSVMNATWKKGEKNITYIDSFSQDNSMLIAENYDNVQVHSLDSSPPNAAKARNYGATFGNSDCIQFIDSDIILTKDWLERAANELFSEENLVGVKGILKEKNPRRNIYHYAASLEWNKVNEACPELGGICMLKRKPFEKIGGYSNIDSGEDPDLSRRLLAMGNELRHIETIMAIHDININNYKTWFKRSLRTGWTYASIGHKCSKHLDFFWLREQLRILIRGFGSMIIMSIGFFSNNFLISLSLCLLLIFQPTLTSVPLFKKRFRINSAQSFYYSLHCSIVIIPQIFGFLKYWLSRPVMKNSFALFCILILCSCSQIEPKVTGLHKKSTNTTEPLEFKNEYDLSETKYTSTDIIKKCSQNKKVSYKIGPGDILNLQVWNRDRLSIPQMVVGPDGKIQIPRIGVIMAQGKTCEDINAIIKKHLGKLYEAPEVNMRIVKYNNNRAFILGRVANPGMVRFQGQGTLLEALSIAGGLPVLAKKSFLSKCAIIRAPDVILWIDLKELLNGNMGLNANIYNNDVIYIPESGDKMVYIMGEVTKPGALLLKDRLTYLDALMLSGGPNKKADLNKAYLIRSQKGKYQVKKIALNNMIKHGDLSSNFILQDNDILFLSPSDIKKFNMLINDTLPFLQMVNLGSSAMNALGVTKVANQK